MEPLRVLDFNSRFSFSGGGIRTYHLRKLRYFADRDDVAYSLVVPSDRDDCEQHGNARLYHVRTPRLLAVRNYALTIAPNTLRRLVSDIAPDLIEAGDPYADPILAAILRHTKPRFSGVIVGFWHAHYPSAYFEFYGNRLSPIIGRTLGKLGWALARRTYGQYHATIAAADCIVSDLRQSGIERVIQCPLGIDIQAFHPDHRDEQLRRSLGAGPRAQGPTRPLVFFPHRFLSEKGIGEVIAAVPRIAAATGAIFAFAGLGPEEAKVRALCRDRDDCHLLGFIDSAHDMARWHASSDLTLGLSAWETFGFSVLEAMASGAPVVGADRGAAGDWIRRARCGKTVPHGDADALTAACIAVLQDPDHRAMGQRGRAFVAEHFSWDHAFARMLHYYRRLVAAHRAGEPLTGFPYLLDTGAI